MTAYKGRVRRVIFRLGDEPGGDVLIETMLDFLPVEGMLVKIVPLDGEEAVYRVQDVVLNLEERMVSDGEGMMHVYESLLYANVTLQE